VTLLAFAAPLLLGATLAGGVAGGLLLLLGVPLALTGVPSRRLAGRLATLAGVACLVASATPGPASLVPEGWLPAALTAYLAGLAGLAGLLALGGAVSSALALVRGRGRALRSGLAFAAVATALASLLVVASGRPDALGGAAGAVVLLALLLGPAAALSRIVPEAAGTLRLAAAGGASLGLAAAVPGDPLFGAAAGAALVGLVALDAAHLVVGVPYAEAFSAGPSGPAYDPLRPTPRLAGEEA
jgi:hypothetical protein